MQVPVHQYRHRQTGEHRTVCHDAELDDSGWLPEALNFLLLMATELPPDVAAPLCRHAGYPVSRAELDRLLRTFGQRAQADRHQQLRDRAFKPLEPAEPGAAGRVMVAQLDGCVVLGQPDDGRCPGIEVKAVMVYPELAPGHRVVHADVRPIAEFQPACAGLLREAGLRAQDVLVGLGDGAPWVAATLELMGAAVVLDVFHAVSYVDTVMEHLGWNEPTRLDERRAWLRGEHDAEQWLKTHLPAPPGRRHWSEAGCTAARYLLDRVEQMHYPSYRAQGWPIGSGQIEGANKSVIGHRMKRAGQHWSRPGAAGMAALRARAASVSHPLPFHTLRHSAFPVPHF